MDTLLTVGGAIAAGAAAYLFGRKGEPTPSKAVPPDVEAALVKQAVPIAVQQINAGVPVSMAARAAASKIVDMNALLIASVLQANPPKTDPSAPMIKANIPSLPLRNSSMVDGDPYAGPYYIMWEVVYSPPSPKAGTRERWTTYFATAKERDAAFENNSLWSARNRSGSGIAMPTNFSRGGPDVNQPRIGK
jgi:hypothetical protein